MLFSVDAHALGCHLTGNEVYVRNLLESFAELDSENRFLAFISRPHARAQVPPHFLCAPVSANPFRRLGLDLPRQLRRHCPALLHVQYTAPLRCPAPVVVSVHDVSFLEYPKYFTAARALQLRITVERTVRTAAQVITGSRFSRDCIIKAYGLPESRISVVPNAAESRFRPIPKEQAFARVQRVLGLTHPYLLTVGDLQPRKNQIGLLRAFAELIRQQPALSCQLVIAGKAGWQGGAVLECARSLGLSDRVRFTGFVDDEDLPFLYAAAEFFIFPSLYEGFGIPVLEAMACGKAVACSDATAIPEVADAAAIFFNPHSIGDMAAAMRALLSDAELRGRYERLGLARSRQFSWRETARRTLEIYYQVAGRRQTAPPKAVAASLS